MLLKAAAAVQAQAECHRLTFLLILPCSEALPPWISNLLTGLHFLVFATSLQRTQAAVDRRPGL
jgi:hypothetical protein